MPADPKPLPLTPEEVEDIRMPLTDAAWRELEMDALASDGRITDADVKRAIARNRPRIEQALDAERPSREGDHTPMEQAYRDTIARLATELAQARAERDALAEDEQSAFEATEAGGATAGEAATMLVRLMREWRDRTDRERAEEDGPA